MRVKPYEISRRAFVLSTAALAQTPKPTNFQIACMTLPYAPFPMQRALEGIAQAGYRFVAWGTTHMEGPGDRRPALALDAPPADAKRLAGRCHDMGLQPVMMFSTVQLEEATAGEAHLRRIDQAAAAGIPFLLTFGKTAAGQYDTFIGNLKRMAPVARSHAVTVVIKQHGGNT